MKFSYQEKEEVVVQEDVMDDEIKNLVVYNDDFNTFDHVIDTLIRVCRHTQEQAEQCTYIIHYRGKCSVKEGAYKDLQPMKEAICEEGIDAKIH